MSLQDAGIFVSSTAFGGGTLEFDDGTNPAETYQYDDELGLGAATLYSVCESLVSWLNDAGRAWSGTITSVLDVPDAAADPFRGIDVRFSGGTFDVSVAGGLGAAATGWSSGNGLTLLDSAGAPSGVACRVALHHWHDQSAAPGATCQGGSWAMHGGGNTSDSKRPSCQALFTEPQAAAFAAALRSSGSPRHAHVYDGISDAWRLVSLGPVRARFLAPFYQSVTMQVLG